MLLLGKLDILESKDELEVIPQGKVLINTINAHSFNTAQKDDLFAEALKNGDYLIPDGASIVKACRWLKCKSQPRERVAGWDLFEFEMGRLDARGGRCMFMGSSPKVLALIVERAKAVYPNIEVVTYSPPYKPEFTEEDNEAIIRAINVADPDLLWIGMTAPKQEKWTYAHWDELDIHCHVGTIGAVFDFFCRHLPARPAVVAGPFVGVALPVAEGAAADVAALCHWQSSFPLERPEGEACLRPNFSNATYHQKRICVKRAFICLLVCRCKGKKRVFEFLPGRFFLLVVLSLFHLLFQSTDMLRNYQEDMRGRIARAWRTHRSVMVQMPTGTGKTHLLAAIIKAEGEAGGVWIVAHRRELVEQIRGMLVRYGVGRAPEVRVMSVQWLSRHWGDLEESPQLIVVDEAHHALAETYREIWRRFPEARKLGVTATPCRLDGRGFTDLFDVLLLADGIADFIREGWLSAFDYMAVREDSEDQRLVDSLVRRGADGDFLVKEMDAVLNRRSGIERLCEAVERYASGKKGIVYAVSISHARRIADCYNNKGISAVAIDCRTSARLRRRLVEDFRQGRVRVLVNVDVFSEGFDCPDVEFVQLARPHCRCPNTCNRWGVGCERRKGRMAAC